MDQFQKLGGLLMNSPGEGPHMMIVWEGGGQGVPGNKGRSAGF